MLLSFQVLLEKNIVKTRNWGTSVFSFGKRDCSEKGGPYHLAGGGRREREREGYSEREGHSETPRAGTSDSDLQMFLFTPKCPFDFKRSVTLVNCISVSISY